MEINENKDPIQQIILSCYQNNGIKFGDFTLKSGIKSPIYVDLRFLVSFPKLLKSISGLIYDLIVSSKLEYDMICGVPYTALPIATCISTVNNIPMIMIRKERKVHGTGQLIEGKYNTGSKVLIIEDIISSGTSILETAIALRRSGLVVNNAIVFLDRQQNGIQNMSSLGINVESVIDMSKALNLLLERHKTIEKDVEKALNWIKANPLNLTKLIINESNLSNFSNITSKPKTLRLEVRINQCTNALTRKIFELMRTKQTNLCVAVDLTNSQEILCMADKLGPHILILKTHIDIIEDFTTNFITSLKQIAANHNFLIFEDRKFADIGKTVELQFSKGIYKISDWADITNAHIVSGPGIISALKSTIQNENECFDNKGCLLIAQMSSKGNMTTKSYSDAAYTMAIENKDFVIGFVSQSRIAYEQTMLHFCPGVHISDDNDKYDQIYVSPETAVNERGADIIIVGRGITNSEDPKQTAILYQKRGFDAYIKRDYLFFP